VLLCVCACVMCVGGGEGTAIALLVQRARMEPSALSVCPARVKIWELS
jgi:hypothetical protein